MPDPVPGSPEHAASMLAKARGITYEEALTQFKPAEGATASPPANGGAATADTGNTGNKPTKPDWCPDKFWNAETGQVNQEAMAKSYGELERSRSTTETPAVTPPANGLPTIDQPNVDPAAQRAAAFKVASEKAAQEFAKDGKLTAESYKSLADIGYPKDVVDSYIAGQRALQDQYISGMHSAAGGKESYDAMIAWARTNLKPEEAKGFDAILRAGNLEQTKVAVSGLKARFDATVGKQPTTTVQPTNVDASRATGGYTSRAEMIADMASAKYRSGDPAFHAQVRSKMQVAIRNKVDLGLNTMVSRA